jgi:hypothetical protein
VHSGLPTCPERDLPDDVKQAAALIIDAARHRNGKPGFLWARSILKPPSWYADLSQRLDREKPPSQVTVVDPYTFFGLIRYQFTTNNQASSPQ